MHGHHPRVRASRPVPAATAAKLRDAPSGKPSKSRDSSTDPSSELDCEHRRRRPIARRTGDAGSSSRSSDPRVGERRAGAATRSAEGEPRGENCRGRAPLRPVERGLRRRAPARGRPVRGRRTVPRRQGRREGRGDGRRLRFRAFSETVRCLFGDEPVPRRAFGARRRLRARVAPLRVPPPRFGFGAPPGGSLRRPVPDAAPRVLDCDRDPGLELDRAERLDRLRRRALGEGHETVPLRPSPVRASRTTRASSTPPNRANAAHNPSSVACRGKPPTNTRRSACTRLGCVLVGERPFRAYAYWSA